MWIFGVSRDYRGSGIGSCITTRYALRCVVGDTGDGFSGAAGIGGRLVNGPLLGGTGMKWNVLEGSLKRVRDES